MATGTIHTENTESDTLKTKPKRSIKEQRERILREQKINNA